MISRDTVESQLNVASENNAPAFLTSMLEYADHCRTSRFGSAEDLTNTNLSLKFSNALLQEIEDADSKKLMGLIQVCAKANGDGKNTFYWVAWGIVTCVRNKSSLEQLTTLIEPLSNLIKKTDADTLPMLIQACSAPAFNGKNAFYHLAGAINDSVNNNLSSEHLITITQLFVRLIEKTDANSLATLVQAWAKLAERGNEQGKNTFYWIAGAIDAGADKNFSPEHLMTLSQPFVSLIDKADANTLAIFIQACSEPNANCEHAFYWLASAIARGAYNKFTPEQLFALTQPLVCLIEKTDAKTLASLVVAWAKSFESGYPQDTNMFYWLVAPIHNGTLGKLPTKQLINLTQLFVRLIEKADASTLAMILQACIKSAERGVQQRKNTIFWLAVAIKNCTDNKLLPQELASISKPLLLLLEKVTTPEQVKQFTDAILKADAMSPVRYQLKKHLLQNREQEDVTAKLIRLKNYLDPSKPFHGFIAKNNSSIFEKVETDTVKQIRTEVDRLQAIHDQQLLQVSNRSSCNANFSGENNYSRGDETKHGKGL